MSEPKVFPSGFILKRPREGAPEFVKGSISIKVQDFKAFLDEHVNDGWVNLDILLSKEGKLYTALNQWKPAAKTEDQHPF